MSTACCVWKWAIADSGVRCAPSSGRSRQGRQPFRHHPLRKNDELRGRGLNQIGPFLFIQYDIVSPLSRCRATRFQRVSSLNLGRLALFPLREAVFYSAAIAFGWPSASAVRAVRMRRTSANRRVEARPRRLQRRIQIERAVESSWIACTPRRGSPCRSTICPRHRARCGSRRNQHRVPPLDPADEAGGGRSCHVGRR